MEGVNYKEFENMVLASYNQTKDNLSDQDTILCNYIGKFNQDILISIISLTEHSLVQNSEPKKIRNRLLYIIIECVQNIIYHSDDLPDNSQLTYLLVTNNNEGYEIYATNTILNTKVKTLEDKINSLMKESNEGLSKLFHKKMKAPTIDDKGNGGLGLITILTKSERNFAYSMSKLSKDYSLFQLKIKLKYKDFN